MGNGNTAVLAELIDAVLFLTINRPDASNAVNGDVATLIALHLNQANGDIRIGSVVLTGSGTRTFCAGIDLNNPEQLPSCELAQRRMRSVKVSIAALLK